MEEEECALQDEQVCQQVSWQRRRRIKKERMRKGKKRNSRFRSDPIPGLYQIYQSLKKGQKRAKTPGKRKSVQIRLCPKIPCFAIFPKAPQRAFSVFKIYFFESTNNCVSCVKACILYSHIESEGGSCCCMREVREVRDVNATRISVFSYF